MPASAERSAPLPQSRFAEVSARKSAVVLRFTFKSMFDPMEVDQLQNDIEQIVRATQSATYVLDMASVEFVSSGFLGLLISVSQTLRQLGASVRFCNLTAGIARVIKTTHLDQVLDIRADVDAAVADIKG
jgi:anti-anti-sigma factor